MAEFKYIFRQVWDATAELLQNGLVKSIYVIVT